MGNRSVVPTGLRRIRRAAVRSHAIAAAGCAMLAACGVGGAAPPCADAGPLQQLIRSHQARYPAMGIRDAFKLLQQATLGSEHAVQDTAEAAAWMRAEWGALGPGPREPLVDTLGPRARFARVHLRPYRAAGGTAPALLAAFIRTARTAPRDTTAFACGLRVLVALARRSDVPWPRDSVVALEADWGRRGYPAEHHTPAFDREYRPAYRVVGLALLPDLLRPLRK
jgi:hypothetical protein